MLYSLTTEAKFQHWEDNFGTFSYIKNVHKIDSGV